MLKNSWSSRLFAGRKSASQRQGQQISHVSKKGKQDFLSNIVEEGSMEDLPKTFEQEEQYMNECLKSIGNSVEDVRNSEVEEYDFDDFNSIASTTSMLNLAADIDDRLRLSSPPNTSTPQMTRSPPNGYILPPSSQDQTSGFARIQGNDQLTNFQKSLSRVQNWDRLGKSGEQEDWSQVLIQASEAGDLITVQNAVSHLGATKESLINARDAAGNTPLHKAAQNGRLQCLKWLVKRAPIEAVAIGNHDGMTPTAMATQYGQVKCLEWLVDQTEARRELEFKEHSFNLLHLAAKEGQEECLRFLLSYVRLAIDVTDACDSNGVTPAHLAASEGHLDCLQTLVEFNCDVTLKDREGCTPSDSAFKAGQTGCGRYLVVVETCVELSARLASCRKENEDLRNRLQVMENYSHVHMPDRPEAVGGDQSDSSSSISVDSIIYPGSKINKFVDTRQRSSSAPDGESPKGTKKEGTVYEFESNGYLAPTPTPVKHVHHSRSRDDQSMRRRGSFPLTCWEKSNTDDTVDHDNNYKTTDFDKIIRSSSPKTTEQPVVNRPPPSNHDRSVVTRVPPIEHTVVTRVSPSVNERTVVTRPSPRTSNSSDTFTTRKHTRVHFEDSRGQVVNKAPRDSSSSNSVSSSRSQSPYRSDRSTASSTETVLVATPLEHRHTSYRNSGRHDHVEMTHEKPYAVHRAVEKNNRYESTENNQQRTLYESTNKGKSFKEEFDNTRLRNGLPSKLLTKHDSNNQQARLSWHGPEGFKHSTPNPSKSTRDRVNDFELLLVNDSANQHNRLSWHGPDPEDGLSYQEYFAHDSFNENSSRSPERRAQISWADHRNFAFNGQTRRDDYHLPRESQHNISFGSMTTNFGEKPWYETEEVEL